jgi:hypothetical protein
MGCCVTCNSHKRKAKRVVPSDYLLPQKYLGQFGQRQPHVCEKCLRNHKKLLEGLTIPSVQSSSPTLQLASSPTSSNSKESSTSKIECSHDFPSSILDSLSIPTSQSLLGIFQQQPQATTGSSSTLSCITTNAFPLSPLPLSNLPTLHSSQPYLTLAKRATPIETRKKRMAKLAEFVHEQYRSRKMENVSERTKQLRLQELKKHQRCSWKESEYQRR